jgi:phytoene dehydrogenase-like protein
MPETRYDAVVVGSGPNGLSAAIELSRRGLGVLVVEASESVGGGLQSAALMEPGFVHDVCAAIHPLALSSPFFRTLPLHRYGLSFVHPDVPLAHPLPTGEVAVMHRSLELTAERLGPDARAYVSLFEPLVSRADDLFDDLLRPLWWSDRLVDVARFGMRGIRSCAGVARRFETPVARALLAGVSAHGMRPLGAPGSAAFLLLLTAAAHTAGWPCAQTGSSAIATALAEHLRSLGGEIRTGRRVLSIDDLPSARAVLLDLVPREVLKVAGHALPAAYRRRLARFPYGPGVFKVDWTLDGPIPWSSEDCARAGTVHLGGSLEAIAAAERATSSGNVPEHPFVLVCQQSRFDPTRAPPGKHTGWAYCHVPSGSPVDMTEAIEDTIERYAPGFRGLIRTRHRFSPAAYEEHNPNLVGGDIGGGRNDLFHFLCRPVPAFDPYATPNERLYLCSSSTPPGGGVHGMCGFWAARSALRRSFGPKLAKPTPPRASE